MWKPLYFLSRLLVFILELLPSPLIISSSSHIPWIYLKMELESFHGQLIFPFLLELGSTSMKGEHFPPLFSILWVNPWWVFEVKPFLRVVIIWFPWVCYGGVVDYRNPFWMDPNISLSISFKDLVSGKCCKVTFPL